MLGRVGLSLETSDHFVSMYCVLVAVEEEAIDILRAHGQLGQ